MVQTDKVLEFDKIKEKWIELALTEWANVYFYFFCIIILVIWSTQI